MSREHSEEYEQLEKAVTALESQRANLGNDVVDAALAPIREKLAALTSPPMGEIEGGQLRGERRLVTVMFADISGFTALSETLDPEAVRDLMNACFEALVPIVETYGGTVDKFIGDEIMVLFGAPTAHENDPERALRAALEMQSELATFNLQHETDLGLHFGINTGHVIAGSLGTRERQEYSVMGGAVNLAARLEEVSMRGDIFVGSDTHLLTAPLFEFETLEPRALHGIAEPVIIYRLLKAKGVRGKVRGIEGLSSPLVGREAEFQALQDAIVKLQSGIGGIVTLVGEAGLGKSRLVAELRNSANLQSPHLQWVEGRCVSYGGTIAYLLWLDVLRGLLGVTADDAPLAVRSVLRDYVQAVCPDVFDDVYPFLVQLLSLPVDAETETRLRGVEGEGLQVLTFRAVLTLVESATQQHPLVLVCEDLHWADPTSLDLLERMLSLTDRAPLLLLDVFRPEMEHGCWQIKELAARCYHHRHTDLWLAPLSATESTTLVGNLLHIEGLPQALHQRILDHAEGNPFYAEEIIRTLIDGNTIVYDEATGRWQATRDVEAIILPDTLHGVLMARIDRLEQETKRVLQLASVIGRVFLYRVLAEIAREERRLDARLLTLQQHELIHERVRLPEVEYIFKHELTREAAYNGLLRKERSAYHRQVAEILERLFPDRVEELLGLLAHHWEQAGDVEQAITYLRQAGEQAAARYANAEAVAYFSRTLSLLPEDHLEERLALLLAREDVHHLQSARDAQKQDLKVSQDLAETLGDQSAQIIVILRRMRYADETGTWILDSCLLQETLSLIETQDVQVKAQSYLEWGRHSWWENDFTAAQAQLEKAIQLAHAAGLGVIEAAGLRELGCAFEKQKKPEEAIPYLERALQLSREIENRKLEGMICTALANVLTNIGDDMTAQHYVELGIHLCQEIGNRFDEGYGIRILAEIHYNQGAYTSALRHFQQTMILACETRTEYMGFLALVGVGKIFGDLGQYTEAVTYFENVLHDVREVGNPVMVQIVLFSLGLFAHYMGDDTQAQARGQEILRFGQKYDAEDVQVWAWMLLGRALTGLGQLEDANAACQRALESSSLWIEEWKLWIRAGLIRIALLKGGTEAMREAMPHANEILRYWEGYPALRDVGLERFEVCWTCYRLLQALHDPRAPEVLERAYDLLQARAAKLQDPAHRRMFLEDVAAHRDIIAEWERRRNNSL
ncbi:MAG: AAA family ATPase [Anaerolineae bacterium]|nr:AAA family ATPase [Anaerolineae bacterium]